MSGHDHEADGPARAGRNLAELATQLRLRSSGGELEPAPAWADRCAAAARCWRRVGVESGRPAWNDLADGLDRLAAVLERDGLPAAAGAARVAVRLEALDALLARYDAGEAADRLAASPAWDRLGEPAAAAGPAPAAPEAGPVVLLVASPFLRSILASRLAAAGRPVVTVPAPVAVPPLLAGPLPPTLVLCDNEEPTNHLRALRALLGGADAPALVLVASAAGTADSHARRARAAGADAVWPEPWLPAQLPGRAAPGGIS